MDDNSIQEGQVQSQGENFKKIERPLKQMLLYNFLGGIAWSLGILIGTGIIFGIIAYFVRRIDFVPILGKFLANVIKSAQQYHP